ncbi:MAG TPA: putative O-glycosylation ligase, exosortase A system-associated [Sphingomonas sp.]|jgi:probable O-glycosylation ligase (exosortase A-associated)|nr:putative O-glycosylation ligase, exosortase A system-associated [Sphingomonas sp.]
MLDLFLVGFLVAFMGIGMARPFLLICVYAYIDILSPQRLTYWLLNSVPISLIAFVAAVGAWAVFDAKQDTRVAPRQVLLLILMVYCGITTINADFPIDAQEVWGTTWKSLVFAAFLPLTLRTKLRIETLLLFMILSVATIIIVGGIKTAVSGGGYGELNLMVDNNSGLYEGSTISAVAVAIVPLILWFTRFGTIFPSDWRVKAFAYALCVSCLLIPVGTSARTGLLCIALLGVLLWRHTKRKILYLGLTALVGVASIPFLPSSYTQRMETIKSYDADQSASTRLAVWAWTLDYVRDHPFGGGFVSYKQNRLKMTLKEPDGSIRIVTDQARAFHSAYFQMLGEQGYPGLVLWLIINVAGLVRMEILARRYRRDVDRAWVSPLASALQSAHLIYLLGAAFVGIAFQPLVYMLMGCQIGLDTYLARKRIEATPAPAMGKRVAARGGA